MNEQIITLQGIKYALMPLDMWKKVKEELEDLHDAVDAKIIVDTMRREKKEYIPHHVISDIVDGKNPVKVYREYRKITQEELAKKVGISVSMIRKIESGENEGSISTIKAIAKALNEDVKMFL